MAGLVPAIPLREAPLYPIYRDHRDSALRAGPVMTSRIHVSAIDRDHLPGDEVAVGRSEEDQRAGEVFRLLVTLERARRDGAAARRLPVARRLVTLERARRDGAAARRLHVARVLAHDAVAQREARHQRVDTDAGLHAER